MKFRICINDELINKGNGSYYDSVYFKRRKLKQEEFIEEIQKGYAFCPWFKNGKRTKKNFHSSNYVAIDIDDNLTLEEALKHPFIKAHASFLYTTPSHQQKGKKDRFRIVFLLEKVITNAAKYEALTTALINKLGGDSSCKDVCRLFYGSKNCCVEVLNDAD